MRRQGRIAAVAVFAIAAVLATTALAGGSKHADPRKAAATLVRSLRPNYDRCHCEWAASKVVTRNGTSWLAIFSRRPIGAVVRPERLRIYRWNGADWLRVATVQSRSWGTALEVTAPRLTGSKGPDFAIQGCGAADTNCLSVVSDVGGRWHVVPFEYGFGHADVVNGVPSGRLVETEVDACSCAGGPSTFLDERYSGGVFRATRMPGRNPPCAAEYLAEAAGQGSVPTFHLDRVACRDGWAIGVGTGAGYTGRVVGLFTRTYKGKEWRLLTIDNGTALAAVPAIFDLPRSLLTSLAGQLGPSMQPSIRATALIARLQDRFGFYWPQDNGFLAARGALWLIAVVPVRRPRDPALPYPAGAIVYRWSQGRWRIDGRIHRLRGALALQEEGWFVAVPAAHGAVAFAPAGSHSRTVITNAGGRWHVAVR